MSLSLKQIIVRQWMDHWVVNWSREWACSNSSIFDLILSTNWSIFGSLSWEPKLFENSLCSISFNLSNSEVIVVILLLIWVGREGSVVYPEVLPTLYKLQNKNFLLQNVLNLKRNIPQRWKNLRTNWRCMRTVLKSGSFTWFQFSLECCHMNCICMSFKWLLEGWCLCLWIRDTLTWLPEPCPSLTHPSDPPRSAIECTCPLIEVVNVWIWDGACDSLTNCMGHPVLKIMEISPFGRQPQIQAPMTAFLHYLECWKEL